MIACAKRDLTNAEKLLGSEMTSAIERIRACAPANSTKCDDLDRAVHLVSGEQKAWRAWRDARCDVTAFGMEHTSAEEQVRADCRTKITHERIKYLREIGRS